jgi:hypothetical protein
MKAMGQWLPKDPPMGDGEAGMSDTREWNLTMVVAHITTGHSLKNST